MAVKKTRSWKVRHKNENNEAGKFGLKLESDWSESFDFTWKESIRLGRSTELGKIN